MASSDGRPSAGAGRRDAITDVPGIRVGHWTDRRSATGCTAILTPPGTTGGVDVRGAAPGTRETDLLHPGNLVEEVHAVLLGGGSAYGLEAAGGVMRFLREQERGYEIGGTVVPIVPAAILFDLGIGRVAWPDADAGYRAARRATGGSVQQGSVGAGAGATVAKLAGSERALKGGVGTASDQLGSGLTVGALVAVNAVGAVYDSRTGEAIAAPRGETGEFLDVEALLRGDAVDPGAGASTTLAVVATDADLTKTQANRLATVAHDGLARAIWPVHTRGDGDVVFALATRARPCEAADAVAVEALVTRAVERAIVNAVTHATALAGVPSADDWLR